MKAAYKGPKIKIPGLCHMVMHTQLRSQFLLGTLILQHLLEILDVRGQLALIGRRLP
jgi:hypothetical protein